MPCGRWQRHTSWVATATSGHAAGLRVIMRTTGQAALFRMTGTTQEGGGVAQKLGEFLSVRIVALGARDVAVVYVAQHCCVCDPAGLMAGYALAAAGVQRANLGCAGVAVEQVTGAAWAAAMGRHAQAVALLGKVLAQVMRRAEQDALVLMTAAHLPSAKS